MTEIEAHIEAAEASRVRGVVVVVVDQHGNHTIHLQAMLIGGPPPGHLIVATYVKGEKQP